MVPSRETVISLVGSSRAMASALVSLIRDMEDRLASSKCTMCCVVTEHRYEYCMASTDRRPETKGIIFY